jgi:hypothetical protein
MKSEYPGMGKSEIMRKAAEKAGIPCIDIDVAYPVSRNWLVSQKAELIADAVSVLETVAGTALDLRRTRYSPAADVVVEDGNPRIVFSDTLIKRIRNIADALEMQNKGI